MPAAVVVTVLLPGRALSSDDARPISADELPCRLGVGSPVERALAHLLLQARI